jgi:hypothetical protein
VSKWWTIMRQEAALAAILPQAKVFRDDDDSFVQRDNILRPTSRKSSCSVGVASLAVLAKRLPDFRGFVGRLFDRGWSLVVFEGDPPQTISDTAAAVEAWQEARRQSRTQGATQHGGQATKEKFEALLRDKCERYREHWGDPRFETDWILAQVGVSRNTMNKYMQATRQEAIRANRARLQAQAVRQRKRQARENT